MKKEKRAGLLILAALAILCFQILYYQLTVFLLMRFAALVPGWSNDCYLMVHHTIQFLLVFIPTLILHKRTRLDFGYHVKGWRKGLTWMLIGAGFVVLMCIADWIIYGFGISVSDPDAYIFQLFFSGLGEEIPYRSIPLVLLPLAYGSQPELRLGKKVKLPLDVIISALFFSIAHISFQFGVPGVYFSVFQLI